MGAEILPVGADLVLDFRLPRAIGAPHFEQSLRSRRIEATYFVPGIVYLGTGRAGAMPGDGHTQSFGDALAQAASLVRLYLTVYIGGLRDRTTLKEQLACLNPPSMQN